MNNTQLCLRKKPLVFTLKTEILNLTLWLPSLSVVQIKSCQSIQELGRQMQLVQKRGSSQCIKFLSAFRRCILLGYLLSLNRKLFQIDRQTERCAECVNWNHHIYPFPSPGAGLEPASAQVWGECQEQWVFSFPQLSHIFSSVQFFS